MRRAIVWVLVVAIGLWIAACSSSGDSSVDLTDSETAGDTQHEQDSGADTWSKTDVDGVSEEDTYKPSDTSGTATDPCKDVRLLQGEWNEIDYAGTATVSCVVENDMTCTLDVSGENALINHAVINNVTGLPVEFTDQGDVVQIDYADSIMYERLFSSAGELYGEVKFQR